MNKNLKNEKVYSQGLSQYFETRCPKLVIMFWSVISFKENQNKTTTNNSWQQPKFTEQVHYTGKS